MKSSVYAEVTLSLTVKAGQPWDDEESFKMIQETAVRQTKEKLQRLIQGNPDFVGSSIQVRQIKVVGENDE